MVLVIVKTRLECHVRRRGEKMTNKNHTIFLLMFIFISIFAVSTIQTQAQAANVTVITVNSSNYTTAIDTAANSSTIIFLNGTYNQALDINAGEKHLVLESEGDVVFNFNSSVNATSSLKAGIVFRNYSDINLNGFTFNFSGMPKDSNANMTTAGILFMGNPGSSAKINNNVIRDMGDNSSDEQRENSIRLVGLIYNGGGYNNPASPRSTFAVFNNTLSGSGHVGILVDGWANSEIHHNSITESNSDFAYGIQLIGGANGSITNNNITGFKYANDTNHGKGSAGIFYFSSFATFPNMSEFSNASGEIASGKIITTYALIQDNSITDSHTGISIGSLGCYDANRTTSQIEGDGTTLNMRVDIMRNKISDNNRSGVLIASCSPQNGSEREYIDVTLNHNNITDNTGYGVFVSNDNQYDNQHGDVRLKARNNRITGNGLGLARYVYNGTNGSLSGPVDASRNYWGFEGLTDDGFRNLTKSDHSPDDDAAFFTKWTYSPWYSSDSLASNSLVWLAKVNKSHDIDPQELSWSEGDSRTIRIRDYFTFDDINRVNFTVTILGNGSSVVSIENPNDCKLNGACSFSAVSQGTANITVNASGGPLATPEHAYLNFTVQIGPRVSDDDDDGGGSSSSGGRSSSSGGLPKSTSGAQVASRSVKVFRTLTPESMSEPVNLSRKNLTVKTIALDVNREAKNVILVVARLKGKPSSISENPPGAVYDYVEISTSNIASTSVDGVALTFAVSKNWLSSNGLNSDNVMLFRYDRNAGGWKEELIDVVSDASGEVTFSAQTLPSVFAITGRKISKTTEKSDVPKTETPPPESPNVEVPPERPTATTEPVSPAPAVVPSERSGGANPLLVTVLIVVVIGIVFFVVAQVYKKKRS